MPSAMRQASRSGKNEGAIRTFTTLSEGMSDRAESRRISTLQDHLNRMGFTADDGNPLAVDGDFGERTEQTATNVQGFLRRNGYADYEGNVPEENGRYDLTTWQALSRFQSRVLWSVTEGLKRELQEIRTLAAQVAGLSDTLLSSGLSDSKLGTDDVTALQEVLIAVGFKDDKGNVLSSADGVFGEQTRQVVMNVQRLLNTTSLSGNWRTPVLAVDGIFGPATRDALAQFLEDYYDMESGGNAFMQR